jgi:hypothetical protein
MRGRDIADVEHGELARRLMFTVVLFLDSDALWAAGSFLLVLCPLSSPCPGGDILPCHT